MNPPCAELLKPRTWEPLSVPPLPSSTSSTRFISKSLDASHLSSAHQMHLAQGTTSQVYVSCPFTTAGMASWNLFYHATLQLETLYSFLLLPNKVHTLPCPLGPA